MNPQDRSGHGWWPYVVPYASFLGLSEIGARLPDAADPWMLLLKPAVALGLVLWFRARGAYPEWRGTAAQLTPGGALADVAVGLGLTVLWVLPYVFVPLIRPEPGGAFDPAMAGPAWIGTILGLRLFGYAIVTPIFEELFVRSFVLRVTEVWETERDFRDVPLGDFSAKSLAITTVVFSLGHVPWEWWVCLPWFVLSSLWFARRRNLTSIMLVHGVTNASLLALAIWGGGFFENPDGTPFTFWFFV